MSQLKIGFAILGVGNGHVSRAREVIPHLETHGEVDIILSGTDAQVDLPYEITHRYHGLIFHLGKKGEVDYWQTLQKFRVPAFVSDIYSFPVDQYDIIINDFEPITARTARRAGVPCVSLSHQAAFASPHTPRARQRDPISEVVLLHYASCPDSVGFHFEPYDSFIRTPVIRREVRDLTVSNEGHITVYLPAYDDRYLLNMLAKAPKVRWEIFSKRSRAEYQQDNFFVRPINNAAYLDSLARCDGLLTSGGFEAPAEALFLGKKLMMVPQQKQYEQLCNAEAAKRLGVPVLYSIDANAIEAISQWVTTGRPMQIPYPDVTAEAVACAVEKAKSLRRNPRSFSFWRRELDA